MIDHMKIDTDFIQNCGSCVLASYSIINKYFTGHPIENNFEDYCRHFKIQFNDWKDAEKEYADHFDNEWKKRPCKGYEIILDLHLNSNELSFQTARNVFNAIFYEDSNTKISEIIVILKIKEAMLNITYEVSNGKYHSVTSFGLSNSIGIRDTNKKGIEEVANLYSLGKLRDSILYVKK